MMKLNNVKKRKRTTWYSDAEFEKQSTNYVVNSPLVNNQTIKFTERIYESARQKKGIDIVADVDGAPCNIDLKAIAQYDFGTFCQELYNSHANHYGWILEDRDDIETDCYFYLYHEIKDGTGYYSKDKYNLKDDNITRTYGILCRRCDVISLIKDEFGISTLDKAFVDDVMKYISKENGVSEASDLPPRKSSLKYDLEDGKIIGKHAAARYKKCHLVLSGSASIGEAPLNVVIDRDALADIAVAVFDLEEGKSLKIM